ncbi:MAG: BMP family ABC transporter substrate-binding protein [Desulfobacterales bacterium]
MNRNLTLLVVLIVSVVSTAQAGSRCGEPGNLCVGLVTDVGDIDDKSFNQSVWEGVNMASEQLGAHVKYIETRDAKDYRANIDLFARNNYDVIVTVGFALGEATALAAEKYPEIRFIGVDQFQVEPLKNLAGLVFHEDRSGFLAGALAALLSKSGTVAAVFGTDLVPPVVMFKKGYEAGARYINPNINVISTYHPGGLDVAFTDPEWGAATTKQAIDQGADVIFGAGGKTGNGCLVEAAAHAGKYCIGVDTDQWITLPEARPCLVSSALKVISPSVLALIKRAAADRFPGGNYFGEVGLAPFHAFDSKLSKEIKDKLSDIDARIRNGSLATTLP